MKIVRVIKVIAWIGSLATASAIYVPAFAAKLVEPWPDANGVIFDNGSPYIYTFGGLLISSPYEPADDFAIAEQTVVSGFEWATTEIRSGYKPEFSYQHTAVQVFSSANNMHPGDLVFSSDVVAHRRILMGMSSSPMPTYNDDLVVYGFNGLQLNLRVGTYYLGLTQYYSRGSDAAVVGQAGGTRSFEATNGSVSYLNGIWSPQPTNLSFRVFGNEVTSPVPEESSSRLFMLGFGVLILLALRFNFRSVRPECS